MIGEKLEPWIRREQFGAVLRAIEVELLEQDKKWGPDREHTLDRWLAIATEEHGEVAEAVVELGAGQTRIAAELWLTKLMGEAVQAAACHVRIALAAEVAIERLEP